MKLRIGLVVQQRQDDGSIVSVRLGGLAANCKGTKEQIGRMLLEAEQKGNAGKSRLWISMTEV